MYPLFAWDLSTNGASYDINLGSAARVGYYRLQVEFSAPTPKPLTALYFMEYTGTLSLDYQGQVKRSYVI